jgi:hypothetical protein
LQIIILFRQKKKLHCFHLAWLFATALAIGSSYRIAADANASPPGHRLRGTTTTEQHQPLRRHLKKPVDSSTCAGTSIVDVQYEDHSIDESYISCETSNGKSYKVVGVPDSVVRGNKSNIVGGLSELVLPEGSEVDESTATIQLPPGKGVQFKEKSNKGKGPHNNGLYDRSRNLAVTGQRSVLVVRVIATDATTTASVERLSDSVFGNGADGSVDPVTLRSQYLACSHDALEFVEAADRDGTNIQIRNGT